MGKLETEQKPRGWLFVATAGTILLAFLAIVWWLQSVSASLDLKKLDWPSFGALASGFAAVVSAIAGLGAVYAARVALAIDAKAAGRQQERDHRNAVPLAHVFQFEVMHLRNKALHFSNAKTLGNITLPLLEELRVGFDAPMLRAHIHEIGCFDEEAASMLANVVTMVTAVHQTLDPRILSLGESAVTFAVGLTHRTIEPGVGILTATEKALSEYTKIDMAALRNAAVK